MNATLASTVNAPKGFAPARKRLPLGVPPCALFAWRRRALQGSPVVSHDPVASATLRTLCALVAQDLASA